MEHKQSTLVSFLWMNVLKALLIIMVVQTIQTDPDLQPPGDIMFELSWTHGVDCDVDLHVQGPSGRVYWQNRATQFLNYLRDDLGNRGDDTSVNLETAYSRGVEPGAYTIAAHLFSASCVLPIDVQLVVSSRRDTSARMGVIVRESKQLARAGQEITLVNFGLERDGTVVPNSINHVENKIATR